MIPEMTLVGFIIYFDKIQGQDQKGLDQQVTFFQTWFEPESWEIPTKVKNKLLTGVFPISKKKAQYLVRLSGYQGDLLHSWAFSFFHVSWTVPLPYIGSGKWKTKKQKPN